MTDDYLEYFRRRERQERASAKSASSVQARREHQHAAEYYGRLIYQAKYSDPLAIMRASGLL